MDWAVATTLPRCELRGANELAKLQFTCYLPIQFHQDVRVRRALFPGYFFFAITSQWKRIFEPSIINVQSVLMFAGELSHIPQTVIDELRSREENGCIKIPVKQRFWHGQPVRTQNGVFSNIDGIFDARIEADSDRARVLYEILGRPTFVELKEDDLYAVEYGRMSRAKRKRLQAKQRRAFKLATLNA